MRCWAESYCKQSGKCESKELCSAYVIFQILYNYSNIPKRYQYPQKLKAVPPDENIYAEISKITQNVVEWVKSGKCLFLYSNMRGNGKTSVACRIAINYIREMVYTSDLEPVVHFISSAKFLEEMRNQFSRPTDDFPHRLKMIETVPLLIIDDIGAERPNDWVRERLLNIIDERYSNTLSTIYTSNCSLTDLMEQLGPRIFDRIRDSKIYEFKGPSHRGGVNNVI